MVSAARRRRIHALISCTLSVGTDSFIDTESTLTTLGAWSSRPKRAVRPVENENRYFAEPDCCCCRNAVPGQPLQAAGLPVFLPALPRRALRRTGPSTGCDGARSDPAVGSAFFVVAAAGIPMTTLRHRPRLSCPSGAYRRFLRSSTRAVKRPSRSLPPKPGP